MKVAIQFILLGACVGVPTAQAANVAPATAAKRDDTLPTGPAIQKTFELGDYTKTLQMLARVLPLKGDAAKEYDRYALLMLKGESHIRLKQFKSAGDAFGIAADESKDDTKAAIARATERLMRETRGGVIVRKVAKKDGPTQADLLDPAQRETALQILYDDLRVKAQPKIKAAVDADTLPPIAEAIDLLADLRDFELAGAGSDAALAETRRALADRATSLMTRELVRMETAVNDIRDNANVVIQERSYGRSSGRTLGNDTINSSLQVIRRGLNDRDRTKLKDVISTCAKIITTSKAVAKASGETGKGSTEAADQAKTVGERAQLVLTTRY